MRLLRVTNFKIFANVVVWIMLVGAQISYLSAFGAEQSDDITMLAFSYLGSGKTDSI